MYVRLLLFWLVTTSCHVLSAQEKQWPVWLEGSWVAETTIPEGIGFTQPRAYSYVFTRGRMYRLIDFLADRMIAYRLHGQTLGSNSCTCLLKETATENKVVRATFKKSNGGVEMVLVFRNSRDGSSRREVSKLARAGRDDIHERVNKYLDKRSSSVDADAREIIIKWLEEDTEGGVQGVPN